MFQKARPEEVRTVPQSPKPALIKRLRQAGLCPFEMKEMGLTGLKGVCAARGGKPPSCGLPRQVAACSQNQGGANSPAPRFPGAPGWQLSPSPVRGALRLALPLVHEQQGAFWTGFAEPSTEAGAYKYLFNDLGQALKAATGTGCTHRESRVPNGAGCHKFWPEKSPG